MKNKVINNTLKVITLSLITLSIKVENTMASYIGNFAQDAFNDDKYSTAKVESRFYSSLGRYIGLFLQFVATILLFVIIYAGFLWLTAGGNQEQVAKAKKWITNSIIGMIIIGSAYLIVGFVTSKTLS